MIKSLELTNWRTHKNSILTFDSGTNVIVGVMGSGKSSIVNALSYSLFGTFPALKSKQISLVEIITNKPNPCEFAKTKLIFEKNEKIYLVEREIKETGTNEAKLYEGTTLIAGPKQKDVNEKVENILGLNYELFSRAVYAEQNELDFFLKLTPGDRKKKFDELLDLEKYEIARKNALGLKNSLTKENKLKEDLIKQQKNTIESHEEEKIKKVIVEQEQKEKEFTTKKELLEKEFTTKKELLENEEKKEKDYRKLKDLVARKNTTLQTLNKNILGKKEVDVEKLKQLKELNLAKQAEKTMLKSEVKKQKDEFDKVRRTIGEENKVLEYQLHELDIEKRDISKLTGKCPTCKQELDENHKAHILEKNQKDKENNIKQKDEVGKKQEELMILIKEFEKQENTIEKEINLLKEEEYKIKNEEKNANELAKTLKEILELKQELPIIEKELQELNFDEKDIDKLRKDYFETKSVIDLLKSQINSTKELVKSYIQNLEKIEQIKNTIILLEKETNTTKIACEKLGVFENCLIATQIELRESMLATINEAMSNIWENIYPYTDFTDAKLAVVENGYDLQVLTRNNGWARVEGILSGGERSAAALCIRIAFALVLTKQLSMLILDEPTHNLDSNAIGKLSEMLRDSLPGLVEQIFVITHDKQLENAASSKLYLLNRNKDLDEPTNIEIREII
ncbi:MAG: AAA family ATPase [archaeon]|jgi:exonuclease SbcC